ncbi:ScyD/ScyE family protein [Streptomyces sp. NPDC102406]|uniref:ScyD/ScyE family protein n=1 Tax=Streptomyces sp. NPDC102406 TaxID=3366171 RepID=UPI0037F1ABFB
MAMAMAMATAIPSQAAPVAPSAVVAASGLHNPCDVEIQADGLLLVVEAGSGPEIPCPPPVEVGRNRYLGFSTLSTTKGKVLGDLAVHELNSTPDAGNPGTAEVFSNPWGFARDGRDCLVTDAGANDLIRIRPDGSTETVFAFPTATRPTDNVPLQAVPTGVLRGRGGAFCIADMSGMHQGLSRVWRYVPGSEPTVFATGLTDLIDLAVAPDGDLIALSYGSGPATDPGPGTLTRIDTRTGASTPIPTATTLKEPTGLAVNPRGDAYVTSNTRSNTDGELLKFPALV